MTKVFAYVFHIYMNYIHHKKDLQNTLLVQTLCFVLKNILKYVCLSVCDSQDLPGACGVTELYESMELGSLGDGRKLCVLGTQIRKGSSDVHPSAQDAYELILEIMNSN